MISANRRGSIIRPKFLWVPSGNRMIDVVGGIHATNVSAPVSFVGGTKGLAVLHQSAVNSRGIYTGSYTSTDWLGGLSSCTVFAIAEMTTQSQTFFAHLLRIDANSNYQATQVDLAIKYDSSSGLLTHDNLIATTGTTGWTVSSFASTNAHSLQLNIPCLHVMRWKSGEPVSFASTQLGKINLWNNGGVTPTGTITTTAPGSNMEAHISGLSYSSEYGFPGKIYVVGILPYKITNREADMLSMNYKKSLGIK